MTNKYKSKAKQQAQAQASKSSQPLPSAQWDQDTFTIYKELICLMRTLDPFNTAQMDTLFTLVQAFTHREIDPNFCLTDLTPEAEIYLQIWLKLHQVLALAEIDFDKEPKKHAQDVLVHFKTKGGLEYVPRDRTIQGRLLEHAAETKTLLAQLLKHKPITKHTAMTELLKITTSQQEDHCLRLRKDFIMLNLASCGKTELYFHAYVWSEYAMLLSRYNQEILESPVLKRFQNLAEKLTQVSELVCKYKFTEGDSQNMVHQFAYGGLEQGTRAQNLAYVQASLFVAQITNNEDMLHRMEKLLIQLLGHRDIKCRDFAVTQLNCLYDGNDWQQVTALRPVVRCIGQHFKVNLTVRIANYDSSKVHLFLGLSAPSPHSCSHETVLTWHKIEQRNILKTDGLETEISINFGKFWKCGFYDWRLMQMSDAGKFFTVMLTKPPVLHTFPLDSVDFFDESGDDANLDQDSLVAQGRYIVQAKGLKDETFHETKVDSVNQTDGSKGTFESVSAELAQLSDSGVSVLYLMGVFERDNCPMSGTASEQFSGQQLKKANAPALAVTCRDQPCRMLGGEEGFQKLIVEAKRHQIKVVVDCLARVSSTRHHRRYRDMLLNYLDEDGKRLICYGTDGHSIRYEDTAMLNYRKIEAWDILVYEVINFAQRTGVDGIHLDNGQAWPQIFEPDLEELQRKDVDGEPAYTAQEILDGEIVIRNENFGYWHTNVMESYANPFFVKLCRRLWSLFPNFLVIGECWGGFKFEHRQIILARSGIVPRLFKLPQVLSQIFGKKLHRDGKVTSLDQKEPVDSLFSWYDQSHLQVPEGTIMIQSSTTHTWPYPAFLYGRGSWAAVDVLYFFPDLPITFNGEITGEVFRLGQQEIVYQAELQQVQTGSKLRRPNSQILMALDRTSESDDEAKQSEGRPLHRVRSGTNLSALEQTQEYSSKDKQFRESVGPDQGFDLRKIKSHYESRRYLRQKLMTLRYGQMCPIVTIQQEEPQVLSFARYSLMETCIIAINLSDKEQQFQLDLSKLNQLFLKTLSDNTVIVVSSLLPAKNQVANRQSYYFLREYMEIKHEQVLIPFSTSIQQVTICPEDKQVFQKALTNSIDRTKQKILQGQDIAAEQISLLLVDAIENKETDAAYFAGLVTSIKELLLDKLGISFYQLVRQNSRLTKDTQIFAKLIALCGSVALSMAPAARECRMLVESNILGPIVFCTPELGRWSTVGGLGVMVDELTLGLAQLGQQVVVISPYYDRNRRGQTGYLENDSAGIEYKSNIAVQLDNQFTLGVHEGDVGGVKVVFLHNAEIFPTPYPDGTAVTRTRAISVFSKACLEYCCKSKIIPSICVTNDWFTGFIPAYAKVGAFGPTFKGTTFLHICHNLMEDYEGRIYTDPREGWLHNIHQLPRDWVDPYWHKSLINPSKTAIMLSDQWATVSCSYRDDLLRNSPLQPYLKQKPQPFAFPNGIPIQQRLKKLDEAAPDHLTAKKIIQKKYFQFQDLDDSIPLFAFVGRVTSQKGVHLILEIVEELVLKSNYKVQFLVGGPVNMREPYSAGCAHRMWHLKQRYPHNFWAAPEEFFTDGSLINRGADFGLMPSLFEPGGIVQHEFFVGGTPVIAFKTGGLKDSVIEFNWQTETGCGYTFESYQREDFIYACQRAMGAFKNKSKYLRLRQNAFEATMSGERVSKAWLNEFYRLRQKIFYDQSEMLAYKQAIQPWNQPKRVQIFDQLFGSKIRKLYELDDIDFGAASEPSPKQMPAKESEFDRVQREKVSKTFRMHNRGPRHHSVELCGSFDNWQRKHSMQFDHITNQWFVTLLLRKGDHIYKYVIDGETWVVNEEERQCKDKQGNINNMMQVL